MRGRAWAFGAAALIAAFGLPAPPAIAGGVGTTVPPVTTATVPTTRPPTTVPRTTVPRTTATTAAPATTVTTATTTTEPDDDSDSGISAAKTAALVGAILVALALIVAVIVLLSRRRARDRWSDQARAAVSEGHRLMDSVVHGLSTMGQPAAAAHTWSEVESQGADLHRRMQALTQGPPDQQAASAASRADQAVQGLRAAVESDRALRLGPPPPTEEQLGYSEAVVRQKATDLEQAVEDLDLLLRSDR